MINVEKAVYRMREIYIYKAIAIKNDIGKRLKCKMVFIMFGYFI